MFFRSSPSTVGPKRIALKKNVPQAIKSKTIAGYDIIPNGMDQYKPAISLINNRYQIQQTLGTGGMAIVYKAQDLMLERLVAIKVLREDYSRDPAFRERFRLEAKAAANLSHPNIVTVHDFGFDGERLYIVMEYVPGQNLKAIIRDTGRFTIEDALPLLIQACAGIGYAHRAGLVHCDIKPHNILVTPDQRLKVTDFGIARALATIHPDEHSDVVWGSPQYFSPEQAAGAAPSPASDVYSLGVIMYEMLTGHLPFETEDTAELARLHRDVLPVPPSKLNPEIPPVLEQIILKVLSKEPSARYRTTDQLGRILISFTNNVDPYNTPLSLLPDMEVKPAPTAVSAKPTASSPLALTLSPRYQEPDTKPRSQPAAPPLKIDWGTLTLGLIAVLAVGGLIPFWLYIYFSLSTPH
jgi:eukaryotic-like serine/threonine-protein kinase